MQLWHGEFRNHIAATREWNQQRFDAAGKGDPLSRCQWVDIDTYLVNDNLTKVDIASMAHGLEVRVPLLDHRLLETVAAMPPGLRLRWIDGAEGGTWCGKYALKKAASRFYPWEMLNTRKRGFSIPIGDWMGGANKDRVRERLLDASSGLDAWFDMEVVRGMIDAHGNDFRHGLRLWSLLMLSEWRRQEAA